MDKFIAFLKPRLNNYAFWVSVLALVPVILKAFGIEVIPDYNNIVHTLLSLFVVAGLLNNPTTNNAGYADDPILDKVEALVEEVAKVKVQTK